MLETENIAIFADFENIALGAKEAHYDDFDITLILERLHDKGRVLVKRAYADWQRYRKYRRDMHEAGFELLEVPHASYGGKNSADIHMVCDALDLCYTREHVDTFVILSGDSDFSPLVRRLRENNKLVIGIGVKQSTSDLLVENCDEFIYYDDIVRRKKAHKAKRSSDKGGRGRGKSDAQKSHNAKPAAPKTDAPKTDAPKTDAKANGAKDDEAKPKSNGRAPKPETAPAVTAEAKPETPEQLGTKEDALDLVLDVVESLFQERESNVWASMAKQVLRRRKPNFDESYYGYASFSQLILDACERGMLEATRDEKSGGFIIVGFGPNA